MTTVSIQCMMRDCVNPVYDEGLRPNDEPAGMFSSRESWVVERTV